MHTRPENVIPRRADSWRPAPLELARSGALRLGALARRAVELPTLGWASPERARRENLIEREAEVWRPRPLEPARGAVQQVGAMLRRFFDLQAGSIWADVAMPLRQASGKVVDVGCGAQPYRSLLSAGAHYVGLDVVQAKERFGYEAPGTVYFDGGEWPVAARQASLVLCTEVLEHMVEPRVFLGEAFRALLPGGRLLLTVPFAARWHFVPFDYWRFTPSSLRLLLEEAGFADVVVWARGNALTVACYKVMALMLPWLFPDPRHALWVWPKRLMGAVLLPLFVALAVVANLSLWAAGGDDCLGYTVHATRPVRAALQE